MKDITVNPIVFLVLTYGYGVLCLHLGIQHQKRKQKSEGGEPTEEKEETTKP